MLPLATTTWDNREIDAMNDVIASGQFTMNKYVKKFELDYAEYNDSKYCVMVNSGSSANLLAISSLFYRNSGIKLRRGDEVIVPAVSWSTTYAPLIQFGLRIKVVDVDLDTLNMDLEKLKDAITDKTRMIVCVNLLGNSNDFKVIDKLIENKEIILFEDNCESMGATYDGKKTGSFGLVGTTSTFFSHIISTIEGGLIVTDDEELYHIMLSMRAHGWTRELPEKNKLAEKSDDEFYEQFRFILPGYNLRPTELNGAIGIQQLKKIDNLVKERRENAKAYKKIIGSLNNIKVQLEVGKSCWLGFSLIIKNEKIFSRYDVLQSLKKNGIETRPIVAGNIVHNEFFKKYANYEVFYDLNNSDIVHDNGFFIGNHGYDISDGIKKVNQIISEL